MWQLWEQLLRQWRVHGRQCGRDTARCQSTRDHYLVRGRAHSTRVSLLRGHCGRPGARLERVSAMSVSEDGRYWINALDDAFSEENADGEAGAGAAKGGADGAGAEVVADKSAGGGGGREESGSWSAAERVRDTLQVVSASVVKHRGPGKSTHKYEAYEGLAGYAIMYVAPAQTWYCLILVQSTRQMKAC